MNEGWLKMHRSILKKGWFSKPEYVSVWIFILTSAVYQEQEYLFDGKIIKLQPGQFVTTRNEISKKCGIHRSTVERILNLFKNELQIEQVSGSRSRLISILKWHTYQNNEPMNEQHLSNGRATLEQQVSANKEGKKERKKEVFTIPGLQEVLEYMYEREGSTMQGETIAAQSQKFVNYYSSNGWKVGKNPMKDWKAAVRTWLSNIEKYTSSKQVTIKPKQREPKREDYFTDQQFETALKAYHQK